MFIKVEPSGCCERRGLVQIRLSMYLDRGDYGYDTRHIRGRDTSFHNHFIYVEPEISDEEIIAQMQFHLPNFYAAWCAGEHMLAGWDTRTRMRPKRYDGLESPELYALRRARCQARVAAVRDILAEVRASKVGETFPATAIDVGSAATDRGNSKGGDATYVLQNNPANETGQITSVEIYAVNNMADTEVATFDSVGAATFTTRDSELIGVVISGAKRTFSGLDMDVSTGDYIGVHVVGGDIEYDNPDGGAGLWWENGDWIPCSAHLFGNTEAGSDMSLYGIGTTPPPPTPGKPSMAAKMIAGKLI